MMLCRPFSARHAGISCAGTEPVTPGVFRGAALLMAAALALAPAAAAWAQRPNGMDTSFWDGDLTPATWQGIYNAGYVFAFVKATQGVNITDPEFFDNITRAPQAGILTGCYHFAKPSQNSATAEANYFVSVAGPYITAGYLRPVLDLEDGSSLGATALSNWVNAWMNQVELLTGVEPIIYTNTNYATYYLNSTVADRDLWIAQYWTYPDPQNGQPDIGVFNSWAFWQWTANCSIPGVPGSADCNVFNGTLEQLETFVIPAGVQPPYVVESRSGGQHYSNYSETGTWSNGSSKSTAPLCTPGIGHRWCTLDSSAKTAVFRFTPATTGVYEIFTTNCTTSNSGNPLIHRIAHAGGTTSVGVCQNTTCNPNAVNVWYSLGQYTLNAGTQYSVTLDGSTAAGSGPSGNAGRADAVKWVWVGPAAGPTITQHPAPQNVCPGSAATFTVAATGQGTLAYQWQKNGANLSNGGHYSGVTTATLTVSPADSSDVASYRCVVTDANGTAASNEAALSLRASTTITQHPSSQSVASGGTAVFTVAASGDGTLTYQWQKNGANLSNGGHYSGVTTATLTISNCDAGDAADYRCVVTAGCGTATSNAATLTVVGGGTVVLSDAFDTYATDAAYQAVWTLSVGNGGTLSTAAYFSSPKSIYFSTAAARSYRNFTATSASDAVPIVWTIRIYDNNTTALDRQWCELLDASPSIAQILAMGKCNVSESMRTYYAARVAYSPGPGWITLNDPGAPVRSIGWHEIKAVIKSTKIDFYVDGVIAKANVSYANSQGQFSFDQARIGSGYSSSSAAYFDNFSVISGQ